MSSVVRLKNAPKGSPYVIERIDDLPLTEAHKAAALWWDSKGTLAVIVLDGDHEDGRYTRDYIDESRVPRGWVSAALPPRPPPLGPVPPMPETPAPTVNLAFEEAVKPPPTLPPGTFMCATCKAPLPPSRKYPGDDDPTPSGRLADNRCPECGRRVRVRQGTLMSAYLTARGKP